MITLSKTRYRVFLVYALLLMISYGALVETVHSHGLANLDATNSTASFNNDRSQSSSGGYNHQRDCSMCHFQRQLIDGFHQATVFTLIEPTQIAVVSSSVATYQFTPATTHSGRAPPQTL